MEQRTDIGLYLHIPFCRQRCHFCAFYLEIPKGDRLDSFLFALERELDLYRAQGLPGDRPLQTVYLGGGTPTVIPARRLATLLDRIRRTFPVSPQAEVTVEAHPSTVGRDDLRILADAGVTRISFGAESMNQKDFIAIGRPGSVAETEQAVANARAAGFTNINLDLMYGLPGQTLESWSDNLQSLLKLDLPHVSCYALTIEEGTKLALDVAKGLAPAPDDSLQIDMEAAAESTLGMAGLARYEISNYARPGFACRHNQLYWTNQDYLGLGPSAQSYVDGVRFGNVADLETYTHHLRAGRLPVSDRTSLSPEEQRRDALIFGLRLLAGVPRETALDHPAQQPAIEQLTAKGLIIVEDERIRLTALGRRYADSVAEELF
ncbi:radical SAM family heme chaperone HemW [Nitrospira sp. NS4]|uniref:radical SAM family heme chaperone HemW n=1 Tax=Nitrospira sp. NS4 TaxID=3414498 RepID=UPI003C2C6E7B